MLTPLCNEYIVHACFGHGTLYRCIVVPLLLSLPPDWGRKCAGKNHFCSKSDWQQGNQRFPVGLRFFPLCNVGITIMVLLPLLSNPRHGLKNSVIGGCHGMDAFLKKRFFFSQLGSLPSFFMTFFGLMIFVHIFTPFPKTPPRKTVPFQVMT